MTALWPFAVPAVQGECTNTERIHDEFPSSGPSPRTCARLPFCPTVGIQRRLDPFPSCVLPPLHPPPRGQVLGVRYTQLCIL